MLKSGSETGIFQFYSDLSTISRGILDNMINDFNVHNLKSNKEKNDKFIATSVKDGVLMFGKHHGFSSAYTKKDVDEVLNGLEKTAKEIEDFYK